jgi:hypothetical protein
MAMANEQNGTPVVPLPATRDDIRSKIFSPKKLKSKVVNFFGTEIEIRQSRLSDIVSAAAKEDREGAVIDQLIDSAYIPGTDTKVFDDADRDSLLQLPFGNDFMAVNQAILELTQVNFLDKGGS